MTNSAAFSDGHLPCGLDGEMSGNDPSVARLIQAGFALRVDGRLEIFSSLISHRLDSWDAQSWSAEAEAVHGISREQLVDAPSAEEVDAAAAAWLIERGADPKRRVVLSIGFNVGAFDHPFFRATLPTTMALATHRAIDLNSVCFTLDGMSDGASQLTWTGWKDSLKAAAHVQLDNVDGQAHDAGWDAAEAYLGWEWLRDTLRR